MSQVGQFLDQMRAAMSSGFPARVCTRSLLDFAERDEEDLDAGTYTFLADGLPEVGDYASYLGVMLVGQVHAGEDRTAAEVEELELTMIDEILALKRAASVHIDITAIHQSRQLEVPYGWVRAQLRVGPLDLTPPVPDAELDDFVTFHADWDVPPHESAAEHQKWLNEPPDHSTSAPDATDDVTLEQ